MPRSSQLHQNRPLENISVAFKPQGLIADALSPRFMVINESNQYYVYSKDNLRIPTTLRADSSESNKSTFALSTATYTLEEHALHDDISDRQIRNADKAIKLDIDVTETLTGQIQLERERDVASLVMTATNWANTTSLTAAAAWSANTTVSNPILQIDSAASTILLNSGKEPNVVVVNNQTFKAIKEHISLTDRIKYTSTDSVSEGMIAKLFSVDKLLVGKAVQNNAEENLADSLGVIWTDSAFVGWIEPNPGLRKVSALYTFWQSQTGVPFRVKKWREEPIESDRVEVSAMYDNQIVASDCGFLIVNTIQ